MTFIFGSHQENEEKPELSHFVIRAMRARLAWTGVAVNATPPAIRRKCQDRLPIISLET